MRSVSVPEPTGVVPISQKRWPNSCVVSCVFLSFSIRNVPLPLNGEVLLWVGVVEYTAKIESTEQAVPPAARHTVATYCGRSETSYTVISRRDAPDCCNTLRSEERRVGK